jgi:hypothetical protein
MLLHATDNASAENDIAALAANRLIRNQLTAAEIAIHISLPVATSYYNFVRWKRILAREVGQHWRDSACASEFLCDNAVKLYLSLWKK